MDSCFCCDSGKQSQLLLKPTKVELGLQVGVEFDKIIIHDGMFNILVHDKMLSIIFLADMLNIIINHNMLNIIFLVDMLNIIIHDDMVNIIIHDDWWLAISPCWLLGTDIAD